MTWLAGVDGCRIGWFRVIRNFETGELRFDVLRSAAELLTTDPIPDIVALDIPIGLPDSGSRDCDREARRLLGSRRSSVFPAPVRPALAATDRDDAARITEAIDGRRVSAQGWAIYPKMLEVDVLLQTDGAARDRIYEVHPEVCFRAWAGGHPMVYRKKSRAGKAERAALANDWLGVDVLAATRGSYLKKHLADDDILDAIAALWTAARIAEGVAESIPVVPSLDAKSRPMRIVFLSVCVT